MRVHFTLIESERESSIAFRWPVTKFNVSFSLSDDKHKKKILFGVRISHNLKWTYTVRQIQIIMVKKLLNRDFCLIFVVGGLLGWKLGWYRLST